MQKGSKGSEWEEGDGWGMGEGGEGEEGGGVGAEGVQGAEGAEWAEGGPAAGGEVRVLWEEEEGEEEEVVKEEEVMTEEEFVRRLEEGEVLKAEGNACFRRGDVEDALDSYERALERAPSALPGVDAGKAGAAAREGEAPATALPASHRRYSAEVEARATALRAACHGNAAACHLRMARPEEALAHCDDAVFFDPQYGKVFLRRARAKQLLGRAADAVPDVERCVALDPTDEAARTMLAEVKKEAARQTAATQEEVMGKLKELGNGILGRFGMSLDHFKTSKNPDGSLGVSYEPPGAGS